MTEYKRLTSDELYDFTQRSAVQLVPELTQQLFSVVIELCQYRTKIENGTLMELPCKVGDTLYIIFKRQWSVANRTTYWIIQKTKLTYGNMDRVIKEYGEFVFLTREKAEKRLKELKND